MFYTEELRKEFGDKYTLNEGVYVLNLEEAKKFDGADIHEKQRIKPFIKNSNIRRWNMTFADMKFIYLRWEDDIDEFPTIKKHLEKYKEIRLAQVESYGERTWPWYAIHRPREQFLFEEGPKIVLPYRSKRNTFAYTEDEVYASGDVFYNLLNEEGKKKINIKYLLAVLNSELYYFWLYYKGKRKGDILEMYQQPLAEIPVIFPEYEVQNRIAVVVDELIQSDVLNKGREDEINKMVYNIYGITDEEQEIVKKIYKGEM